MEEEDLVGVVLASLGEGVPSLVVGVAYPAEGAFLGEVVPNHRLEVEEEEASLMGEGEEERLMT